MAGEPRSEWRARLGPPAHITLRCKVRFLTTFRHVVEVAGEHKAVDVSARGGGFLNVNRKTSRSFLQRHVNKVPGESPTPVQTGFIIRIDDVAFAKLSQKRLPAILRDGDREVLVFPGPISVTNPEPVFAGAWDFKILIDCRLRFVSTGRCCVPLTLPTLSPLRGHAWTIHSPPRRLCARQVQI